MSTQATIRRFTLELEKIQSGTYPSFNELKDYLERHDFSISPRTLQRDIEQIRIEFGIDIIYNRSRNGYFIEENDNNIESFTRFLEIAQTSNILIDNIKTGKNALSYIQFEARGVLKGIENLEPLLNAIKNKRVITFIHENFKTEIKSPYTLQPYFLKEYNNRWYVIGQVPQINEHRTFGIDRITDLKIKSETFKNSNKHDLPTMFLNVIGLNYSAKQPIDIVLKTTPLQAKYLKTLPLHHSQKITKENKKEVLIQLTLIPNYELIQRILSMADQVTVLSPQSLVNTIKETLQKMIVQYH